GFGRHGHDADQVGPVVAEDVPAALAVVSAGLTASPPRRVFLDAPAWPEWRAALAAVGFREQRPFTRMYCGGRAPTGEVARVFAIYGPEFG
ncbi:MAG TPA: hypothetical protein VIC87_15950, partial [Vicinamibacteria bacterium]